MRKIIDEVRNHVILCLLITILGIIAIIYAIAHAKTLPLLAYFALCIPFILGKILIADPYSSIIRQQISTFVIVAGVLVAYPFIGGGSLVIDASDMSSVKAGDGVYGGHLVISYDKDTNIYSSNYLTKEYLAKSPDDVGAILFYESDFIERTAFYENGSKPMECSFDCEHVTFTLVNRATGRTIATDEISASPPLSISGGGGGTRFIDKDYCAEFVVDWIAENWSTK